MTFLYQHYQLTRDDRYNEHLVQDVARYVNNRPVPNAQTFGVSQMVSEGLLRAVNTVEKGWTGLFGR